MRHVVYACYQPVSMASEQDLEQKKEAYEKYRLTTHWPAMNIRLYDDASAVGKMLTPTLQRLLFCSETQGDVEDCYSSSQMMEKSSA